MEFEYAFLLDALLEEQEQNITIDTTQIPFKTAKRNYMSVGTLAAIPYLVKVATGCFNRVDSERGSRNRLRSIRGDSGYHSDSDAF